MRLPGIFILASVLLSPCYATAWAASYPLPEQLEYLASYQGPLTADNRIPIARLQLHTREVHSPPTAVPLFETSLSVSSEIFPFVEERYPFRIRFSSFYQQQPFASLALEKYKLTDELKHEVTLLDGSKGKAGRYRTKGGGAELPSALADLLETDTPFRYYKPARHRTMKGLLDRLSMLQFLRQEQMKPGVEYKFAVTDGKRLLDYRVKVVGLEQIEFEGTKRQVWKLQLDALYTRKGVTSPRHAPIQMWLSKDQPALPLRFVNHHPLGRFVVELQGAVNRP